MKRAWHEIVVGAGLTVTLVGMLMGVVPGPHAAVAAWGFNILWLYWSVH